MEIRDLRRKMRNSSVAELLVTGLKLERPWRDIVSMSEEEKLDQKGKLQDAYAQVLAERVRCALNKDMVEIDSGLEKRVLNAICARITIEYRNDRRKTALKKLKKSLPRKTKLETMQNDAIIKKIKTLATEWNLATPIPFL